MGKPVFEILDSVDTSIGVLTLRRRELLGRPGTVVTEVTIDHDMLMSSLNTISERALSTSALALHGGDDLRVLVGGLGLGYTAQAALADPRVAHVRVVDRLPAVMGWLKDGLLPLSETLNGDARLEVCEGDVYAELLADPASEPYDLILIDVDHSPTELLDEASAPFYMAPGQYRVAAHLAPGGVLAVWSAGDDDGFAAVMASVFPHATREHVHWVNELIGDGQEIEDVIFLGRL
jgi:spermidine synthase